MSYTPLAIAYANSAVTVTTTSAQLVAALGTGKRVVLKNLSSSQKVYIGSGTVTTAAGMELLPGESIYLETTSAVNARTDANTADVRVWQEYYA